MIKKIVIISSSIGIILNSALSTGTRAQTGRVHGSNIVPVQSGRCFVPIEPHRDAAVVSAARADDGADLVGEAWATNGPKLAHLNTRADWKYVRVLICHFRDAIAEKLPLHQNT